MRYGAAWRLRTIPTASARNRRQLIVTTGNDVAGHRVTKYLAIVRGIVVRSPSFGRTFIGAFRTLAGGNIKEFTEVCEQGRHEAYEQMIEHALELGADAILGMRYDATEFVQGTTEDAGLRHRGPHRARPVRLLIAGVIGEAGRRLRRALRLDLQTRARSLVERLVELECVRHQLLRLAREHGTA